MAEGSRRAAAKLADELAARIERGDLRPGQRLPSARQLAQDQGIALNTAHAAMRMLGDRGLVEPTPRGTYVTDDLEAADGPQASGDLSASIDDTLREVNKRLADLQGQLGQLQETVNALETDPAPPAPDLGPGD